MNEISEISEISEIKLLINHKIINKIIFESDIKNCINIHSIPKEQIDLYFNNCINKLSTKPKLLTQFLSENKNYLKTKYHIENLVTHLYSVGWICALFADKFNLETEYAFELGFFHDIGKPWAKKYIQTKKKIITSSKGHAQIGENIGRHLNLDDKICWCIANHMCSCCHENNSTRHWEYIGSLQCISIKNKNTNININNYANSLACLMIGDDLGRYGDTEKNIPNIILHSENWLNWFINYTNSDNSIKNSVKYLQTIHSNNSIIIQLYGHSGFGKSTMAKKIIKVLDENNITYEYAQRDDSYYNIYNEEICNNSILFDKLIYKPNEQDYKLVYKFIIDNKLKNKVQLDWVMKLNMILDSNSKVKIIDTVQLLYPKSWEQTLQSLNSYSYYIWKSSLKIGYYGFPQSIYGHEFIPKTGKYELIPRDVTDHLTWASINYELDKNENFNPNLIDVAYGSLNLITCTIINYNDYAQMKIPEKQIHLINILDSVDKNKLTIKYIQELIKNKFPSEIINSNEELNYFSSHLIRFGYKDGMQIYNGISRDYRGEILLFDSLNLKYYIGRVNLPVFCDYKNLHKDPIAQELIKSCQEFHIIPKFDGSMFVLTFIKLNTPEYFLIQNFIKNNLLKNNSESYFENELGIWCLGSKNYMFANFPVLNRILNSIISSYNSIENFINKVSMEIKSNNFINIYSNITLIFESIDDKPTSELTVKYKKAFCPFLCWVVWDNNTNEKNIILPKNIYYINPIPKITTVNNWDDVIKFKDQAHYRLLEGSELDEPEGYVVWIANTNIGIKLKHYEYYVAHKPYLKYNIEFSKHIEFSDEYSKLRPRLLKFQEKPYIKDITKINIDLINNLFLDSYEHINSKKNWVLYWKINSNKLDKILDEIENDLLLYYPQFINNLKNKGFNLAMDYFIKRDKWITYFLSSYLKI